MIDYLIDVGQDRIDQTKGITREIRTIASVAPDMNDVAAFTVEVFQV